MRLNCELPVYTVRRKFNGESSGERGGQELCPLLQHYHTVSPNLGGGGMRALCSGSFCLNLLPVVKKHNFRVRVSKWYVLAILFAVPEAGMYPYCHAPLIYSNAENLKWVHQSA
jgi:hypothetical protein